MKKYSIINACSDFGVHVNGAKLGPETISKDIKEIELGTKISNFYTLHAEEADKELDKNNKKKNTFPKTLKISFLFPFIDKA